MSNQEFENYLKLIGKLLQLSPSQQAQISVELRDHLRSRVTELEDDGLAHEDAVSLAFEEFGDAALMAKNFQTVMKLKRRRWMMRFATLSMASVFLTAIFTMAMWPSNARFGAPESASANLAENLSNNQKRVEINDTPDRLSDATRRNLETEAKLREVVSLEYLEMPWSDIERDLEERGGFNIFLDQSARDDSLSVDEPLTFQLNQIPLEKALLMLLAEKNATFHIDYGIVVVISRDDAEDPRYMKVKMFNCRDLIDKLEENQDQLPPLLTELMGHPMSGSGGGGERADGSSSSGLGGIKADGTGTSGSAPSSGGFGGGGARQNPGELSAKDVLLDLVTSMITPEEWVSSGQGMADAKIVNGVLIVKHRQAALGEIESLLKDLVFQVD